jgi:hypothetical protein
MIRYFFWCGVAGSLAFLIADVASGTLAAKSSEKCSSSSSYSFTYNSISKLLLLSAPTASRLVGASVMALSDLLGMAFGFGGVVACASRVASVLVASKHHAVATSAYPIELSLIQRRVYQGGFFLGLAATCNLLSATMFPQDLRGAPFITTRSGTLHLILVAVAILSSLLAIWDLSRTIPSSAFQRFTIGTVLAMVSGAVC